MTATDKLTRLLSLAKGSVTITVNDHRDVYQTVEEWLAKRAEWEHPSRSEIDDDIRAAMVATDTVIEVHVYPDTPVGSFVIVHADLGAALDIAIEAIESKRERAS